MKLSSILQELQGISNYTNDKASWTTWNPYNYMPAQANRSQNVYDDEPVVDPDIERQLIDQAIDVMISRFPELISDKKIKRHHVQMIIGKLTSGEVNGIITLSSFEKMLKKRGIKIK